MEEIKIKYYGIWLNKNRFIIICALSIVIVGFCALVLTIWPLNPKLYRKFPDAIQSLYRNLHIICGILFIWAIIESQFWWNKFTKKQVEIIGVLKTEVETRNNEILDSINYAQRIQRALLASDSFLRKHLSEYFIFFRPKDIVSGDFYWAALLPDERFVLVTADSTGHGVPGAIMSMLNISSLKEAIYSQKLSSPKEILNHVRRTIITTLANDGSQEGGKDGMDCSLICIDFKTLELSCSNAYNEVWVVRNSEVIILPADKMPVGKHDNDQVSFKEQNLQLIKNDMIYTFTDGLQDQFGGPKGKKFLYKKLKELLLSISSLPVAEQKLQINTHFLNWKGNLDQVDDICVIGIRI